MNAFDKVVSLLKAKGWHLYRDCPGAALPAIVAQGRATTIEHGVFYHVLPVTFRDDLFDEIAQHLSYALQSNQIPTYHDGVNPSSAIRGVIVTDGGFAIVPTAGTGEESPIQGYEFDLSQMEDAVKFNISNYNIHYFESIDEIAAFVARNRITPQTPSPLPGQLRWVYARHDANPEESVIYPKDPSPILFRGQNKRFEPCQTTITRGLKKWSRDIGGLADVDQASLILNFIKVQWFVECLRETPAFHWLMQNKIHIDETAIAQHYGVPTGYIDLSQSFDVAAFFACCEYNKQEKRWEAVGSGEGVVYVLDQRLIPPGVGPKPICMQPFPRPSEQWGWVHELTLGDDFDSQPCVKKLVFKHNREASERVLEKFDRGRTLFPRDPLSTVADRITTARQVPLSVARKTIQDIVQDPFGLPGKQVKDVVVLIEQEARVGDARVAIVDVDVSILDDEVKAEMTAVWNQRKDVFFSGIGIRLVRTDADVSSP